MEKWPKDENVLSLLVVFRYKRLVFQYNLLDSSINKAEIVKLTTANPKVSVRED